MERRLTAVTDSTVPRRSSLLVAYHLVLGSASGFALGWFAWVIASRQVVDPPFWPFAVVGVGLGVAVVRWAASTKRGRTWVHALWIPVVAFVLLMTAVIVALRSWGG